LLGIAAFASMASDDADASMPQHNGCERLGAATVSKIIDRDKGALTAPASVPGAMETAATDSKVLAVLL
jgi:hypothetical protein